MRLRTKMLWWLGWRPLATGGFGVFLGFVVVNVVITWGARASQLDSGIFRYVRESLRPFVGVGVRYLIALALIPAIGAVVAGLVLGAILWLLAVHVVNQHADAVIERAVDSLRDDHDTSPRRVLVSGDGTLPLVDPYREYVITVFRLDEQSLGIEQHRLGMSNRQTTRFGELQLAYDQISAIDYDGSECSIIVKDNRYSFAGAENSTGFVTSLRDRCRVEHPRGSR